MEAGLDSSINLPETKNSWFKKYCLIFKLLQYLTQPSNKPVGKKSLSYFLASAQSKDIWLIPPSSLSLVFTKLFISSEETDFSLTSVIKYPCHLQFPSEAVHPFLGSLYFSKINSED